MVLLLVSLIAIYLRLDIGRSEVSAAVKWLVHLPFSIYLGWITVATIANVTAVLWWLGWDGFGIAAELWTAIVLAVAVVIATLSALTRRDVAYLLVLVWAFAGIAVKHPDVQVSDQRHQRGCCRRPAQRVSRPAAQSAGPSSLLKLFCQRRTPRVLIYARLGS
jgi:hypothetical protein